jgi:hypothetical protein
MSNKRSCPYKTLNGLDQLSGTSLVIDNITIQGPTSYPTYTLTLPPNDGSPGQILSTNGTGVLSWVNDSTSTGTVTSVSASVPAFMTVSVTNPTTTPNIAISASATGAGIIVLQTNPTFTDSYQVTCGTPGTGNLRFVSSGNFNFVMSGLNGTSGSAADLLFSDMGYANEWMRLTQVGYLGIGTAGPQEKLHVAGSAKVNDRILMDRNSGNGQAIRVHNTDPTTDNYIEVGHNSNTANHAHFGHYYIANNSPSNYAYMSTHGTKLEWWGSFNLLKSANLTVQSDNILYLKAAGGAGTIRYDGLANFTLPVTTGTAGQVLSTDGTGVTSWTNALSGVTSVGASSPITSSGGTTPIIGLTTVPTTLGGTGLTTIGTNGQVLTSNGLTLNWTTPTSGTVTSVTASTPISSSGGATPNITLSTVPTTLGGTGLTTVGTNGQVLASNGTILQYVTLPTPVTSVTATSPIVSSGGATPDLSLSTVPTTLGGTGLTTVGTSGQVLTSNGTTLSWQTPTTGTVTSVSASVPGLLSVTVSNPTSTPAIAIGYSGSALPTANGGTGLTTIGTAGQVLSSTGTALQYVTLPTPVTAVTATSPIVSSGGATPDLSLSTVPTTLGGTGLTTVGTNGQVLTSNGTTLSWQTPSGGGSGTVTSVSASVPSWLSVTVSNPTTTPDIAISGTATGTGTTSVLSTNPTFSERITINNTTNLNTVLNVSNTFITTGTTNAIAEFTSANLAVNGAIRMYLGKSTSTTNDLGWLEWINTGTPSSNYIQMTTGTGQAFVRATSTTVSVASFVVNTANNSLSYSRGSATFTLEDNFNTTSRTLLNLVLPNMGNAQASMTIGRSSTLNDQRMVLGYNYSTSDANLRYAFINVPGSLSSNFRLFPQNAQLFFDFVTGGASNVFQIFNGSLSTTGTIMQSIGSGVSPGNCLLTGFINAAAQADRSAFIGLHRGFTFSNDTRQLQFLNAGWRFAHLNNGASDATVDIFAGNPGTSGNTSNISQLRLMGATTSSAQTYDHRIIGLYDTRVAPANFLGYYMAIRGWNSIVFETNSASSTRQVLYLNAGGEAIFDNSSGNVLARAAGVTIGALPIAAFTPGSDPGDTNRNTSFVTTGTRAVDLCLRNIDVANAFWDLVVDGNTGGKFYFQNSTTGNVNMTMDPNGNTGFGTNSPTQKMDVNGAITARRSTDCNVLLNPEAGGSSGIEVRAIGNVAYLDITAKTPSPGSDYDLRISRSNSSTHTQFQMDPSVTGGYQFDRPLSTNTVDFFNYDNDDSLLPSIAIFYTPTNTVYDTTDPVPFLSGSAITVNYTTRSMLMSRTGRQITIVVELVYDYVIPAPSSTAGYGICVRLPNAIAPTIHGVAGSAGFPNFITDSGQSNYQLNYWLGVSAAYSGGPSPSIQLYRTSSSHTIMNWPNNTTGTQRVNISITYISALT